MQRDPAVRQRVLLNEESETPSSSRPFQRVLGDDGVDRVPLGIAQRGQMQLRRQQPKFMQSTLGRALGGGLPRGLKGLEGTMAVPNPRPVEAV